MIALRGIRAADAPALRALEEAAFSDPWSEEAFRSAASDPDAIFLLAEENGALAGYIGAFRVPGAMQIANLAVAPVFRRRGIGMTLLRAVQSAAEADGREALWLEVRVSNAPARALYEKAGFEAVGVRRRYYAHPTEDAILMNKTLLKGNDDADTGH